MRTLWNETEQAWRASPLGSNDLVPVITELVEEATEPFDLRRSSAFAIELALAADTLLRAEDVTELEADWTVIENDPAAAVEVREMLVRRRRWAVDYQRLMSVFYSQLGIGFQTLLAAIPEGCFDANEGDAPFTVPLSSLLEDPAETIEGLCLAFYDDDIFRLDLFKKLRERLATNLVIASGFPPDTSAHEVSDRLVMPKRHKSENASELASLYFAGTPLAALFDFPVPFRVPDDMRFEHCHVIGGTGHGKTQLLQRMIHADLAAAMEDGRSVVVIDSQGDLIQKLVRLDLFSPENPDGLADRLILIDPSDVEFPPSLNLFDAHAARLEGYSARDRERALNGLIELYEGFFGALLGAELTQKQGVIFRYLARLMLAIPGSTIHTLMQLMEDGRPFERHMDSLDGSARHFFATEFFHPSFAATKKQILKRLWGVLATPAFERMFAQRENKVDLFEATKAGKIILINTAKDLLKTEGSALFGRFFIGMLAQAALERSTLPEPERTPTFLYVDEAQEYFDDTIETILSQARKYRVGITLAHQTLDQLSPRLRAAFLSNTSFKCAGGVSSKDARALAGELHTSSDFIEGMRKRWDQTEFAVWLKGRTPSALRLGVPLGFVERQTTLCEEDFDLLLERNRARYCGTLADVLAFELPEEPPPREKQNERPASAPETVESPETDTERRIVPAPPPRPQAEARELGKGGPKHRYLQSLVKGLAEQQGFRATIEAPAAGGVGQVDVLLEREGVSVAVEISVSTPVEAERENVRKCLAAGYSRVALVLAKSRTTQARYRAAIVEGLADADRERLSFLAPEDVPDFIAALAPAPAPSEMMVKGYRVKVSHTVVSPDDAKERRTRLAKLVARSLQRDE